MDSGQSADHRSVQWERKEAVTHALGEAIPAGASWERRSPARPGELRGDLVLPIGQSLVTGLVGTPRTGLIIGVVVFAVAWVLLLLHTRQGLWTVERITGQDSDDDGVVGEPNFVAQIAQSASVRVELAEQHEGGHRLRWVDLPVSNDKLSAVARAE